MFLRNRRLFAIAAAVWTLSLLLIAWILDVWLARAPALTELILAAVLLLVPVVYVVQGRLQRDRRKIEDMRDSALW